MSKTTLSEEAPPSPHFHGLHIDTCEGSLFHWLCRAPEPSQELDWHARAFVYCAAAAFFGGLPLILNLFLPASTMPRVVSASDDYQCIWVGFVVLPLLITFLWSERSLIPHRLLSIYKTGELRPLRVLPTSWWEARFRRINIAAHFAGAGLGAIVAYANYRSWVVSPVSTWLSDSAGHPYATGWFFLIFLSGCFWFLCTIYVLRAIGTISLLWAVVRISEVIPRPFHPDRAGGLSDVAKLGLRNQYLLAAVGIQIICAAVVAAKIGTQFQFVGLALAGAVYLIAGPLIFALPLLPFRDSMLKKKTEALRKLGDGLQSVIDTIVARLPSDVPNAEQEKEINRFKSLMKLVGREPVWPFDVVTIRRFVTAYLAPALVGLLSIGHVGESLTSKLVGIVRRPPANVQTASSPGKDFKPTP